MTRTHILTAALLMLVMPMAAHALEHEFLVLPETMHPSVRGVDVGELRERYRAGDEDAARLVEGVLAHAEQWRDSDGEWWLDRVLPVTPLGMWTTACPFHPERVQDFSDSGWRWSLDEPFRLYCPLCEEEGREYPYYPNPDYADDGTGCYPSDELWRRTHGPEWGAQHPGIPWDRWDGSPHGYSSAGYAYFFRGKWHHLANLRIAKTVLPTLGEAWQICSQVLAEDDPRVADGARYARAAKIGLLTLARAHLGDAYLADIVGEGYDGMLAGAYEGDPRQFTGYVPYTLEDGITGNPDHPAASSGTDIYCDGSQFGDGYADGWLRGFALVRDSYAEAEEAAGIVRATECLLAAHPDDAERLEAAGGEFEVKFGKLDYHVRPYSMLGYHNLDGRLMVSQFRLGRLLGDERIVQTVLDNYEHYLHNSIYGDGLSWEGSPAYTNVTWNTVDLLLDYSRGAPVVPTGHPWFSERLGGLDLYRAQELCNSLAKVPLSCLPNGCQIAWEDSHAAARPQLGHLQQCLRAGATIPEDCAGLFHVTGAPGSQQVSLRDPAGFPSYLLHNNRKIVVRMPRGDRTDVMALDYTWPVGHWHYPPMTLMWFTRGQEVLTDLGYLGAMNRLTRDWIKHCPAHNACVVRDEAGSHDLTHLMRGDPTGVMLDAGWLQAFEVAERNPVNLAALGERGAYGRTVAQIAAGDGASYLLDVMRVRGGARHEWYLHADGEALSVDGAALGDVDAAHLAEHWSLPGGRGEVAWRQIAQIRQGATDGAWRATWAPLRTWDGGEKRLRDGLSYRLSMLPGGPTEIVAAVAPGQRYTDNRDLNAQLHLLCARRENGDAVDEFVAIHETSEGAPLIISARRLEAPEGIVAVRVDRGDEVDYLLSRAWDASAGEARISTPDGELRVSAPFVALTVAEGRTARACAIGEGKAALGDFELRAGPAPAGRLVAFDDGANTLTIEPASEWPEGVALEGRWGIIRHEHGASTFTIRDLERVDGGRLRISLKYTPHLVLNRVRATSVVDENTIAVEPRPAHPWRTAASEPNELGFVAYRDTGAGLVPVGTVSGLGAFSSVDNWGKRLGPMLPTIRVEGDASSVEPGEDLLITRLRPGEDIVEVTPWACFEAE